MLSAAIDIGSNTIRMLVAELQGSELQPLKYARVITRLAGGLNGTGELGAGAQDRSITALKGFKAQLAGLGVTATRCVGTSALREAGNTDVFVARVLEETGIGVEVVPEQEEARLTSLGALSGISSRGGFVVIDIGGGSTEFSLSRDGTPVLCGSVPDGTVKMAEAQGLNDPPSDADIAGHEGRAGGVSSQIAEALGGSLTGGERLVGTAGTICSLAAVDLALERYDRRRVQGHVLGLGRLRELSRMFAAMTNIERAAVKGLEPGRADLIMPGVILTISLMLCLGMDEITVSDRGILEGVLLSWGGRGELLMGAH